MAVLENIQHVDEWRENGDVTQVGSGTLEQDRDYLTNKFIDPGLDPGTGLDNETLRNNVMALAEELKELPHPVVKARAFEYAARNVRIGVSPHDWFPAFGCWDRWNRPLDALVGKWDHEVNVAQPGNFQTTRELNQSGAALLYKDFDHSVPDWDALFSLGFTGIRERARQYRKKREATGPLTPAAEAYFDGIEITYTAILGMIGRFRDYAVENACGNERMLAVAQCLDTLQQGPPQNTYDVLQLVYLYFMFSEYLDRLQVRSLGNLDRTVFPYYQRDLREGRHTEERIREFFSYFLMQWAAIAAPWGHPFYFGGTKRNGESEINELSYLILDEFDKLSICSPKLQLKIAPNTPRAFIDKAVDMIRRGNSSIVFLCEPSIRRAMKAYGATEEDARTCDITGCYEAAPRARGNTTVAGVVNMLKPVELVLHDGVDPNTGARTGCGTGPLTALGTFDDFYAAYTGQLGHVIESIIRCANGFEACLSTINPAPAYSATIENSLATARDAFHNGSVYNITAVLTTGFATAVDALVAVKELVYDSRCLTPAQLKDILARNWQGHERLRLKMLRSKDKFGNGIDAVDALAEKLARFLADTINMRPNGRDGFYISSMHAPPMTFVTFGEKTGATPDGRMAGEEVSRNMSPTMGMDTNGVTALIKSVTRIDSVEHPGDFPLDVMLHPSTAWGEEGLAAVRTILNVYMEKHGMAIQFNILDPETLEDAQEHPDRYQGLQVRVCGWNTRFNDLERQEQDAFIRRARNII